MKEETNIRKLKKELKECQKLRDEYLDGWKRARAEFLNYKKEEATRISELMKYANEGLILKMLPILDNIYISEKNLPENFKDNQWVKGILRIKDQILDFLKSQGVEEIKCLGKKFDPNFHEAVQVLEKKDAKPGTVIEEIKKGYTFQGRVLRPARVKIIK